tara:strand:- start:281 stop:595 length:315 start_codon:yes stop_codon:yes gene_type:complete
MKIMIDTDSTYAPCAYLICALDDSGEWDTRDESRTVLVQSDWDYPGIASAFGWSHPDITGGFTDGTIDGPTATAGDMITEAAEYLDSIAGDPACAVECPGYFSS